MKDRYSFQSLGYLRLSLQEIIVRHSVVSHAQLSQGDEAMEMTSIYSPLHSTQNEQDLIIRTFDLLHKTSGTLNTIGSISLAVHFDEEPLNLFSKQPPQMPPIPEMTPAVASELWVRIWQIAKIFMDLFDYARFAISWEFPPLSFSIAVCYFACIYFFDGQYCHFYLFLLLFCALFVTFILRKKHLIAKTIQTNEADKDSSYYVPN